MGKSLAILAVVAALLWRLDPWWAFMALFSVVVLLAALFLLIELANLLARWDSSDPEKETPPEGRP